MALADLKAWLDGTTVTTDEELERLLNVATLHIESRVTDPSRPEVEQAILMYAARLAKRKASPEGTIDMGDYSASIKTWDADVEALIAPWRRFGWA